MRTKSILRELRDLSVRLGEGNVVQPEGRAIMSLKRYLPKKMAMPESRCGEMPYTEKLDSVRSIGVEPDGRIAVCNQFYIGNASDTDVIKLIEQYDPYMIPEAKAILEDGMKGLLRWAAARGIQPDSEGYYSICDMCMGIRRRARETSH
jgi:hypothetical protein